MNILLENIPERFIRDCKNIGHDPIEVLKGFIGDFCYMNEVPQDQFDPSYGSKGSDERRLANDYVERAFPNYGELDV